MVQSVWASMQSSLAGRSHLNGDRTVGWSDSSEVLNPLDRLTAEERLAFLAFVKCEEQAQRPWKITLLNDWLNGRSSGSVQFVRERYGTQWLEQVTPAHLARYNDLGDGELLRLKIGDRIEVTNGLWEWVQDNGPCSREWFLCTVVSIHDPLTETSTDSGNHSDRSAPTTADDSASCVIRFDDGAEYEIQGLYDWNRPNWRWVEA